MLPGRLGARFALEALFLVLLAVGAGLADLRPAFIILVIAAGWLLVALAEFTADRIARSPVSYLLPAEPEPKAEAEAEEAEHVFGPPVEERTVVAPPQALEDTQEPVVEPEPVPEPAVTGPEPEPDPEAGAGAEPEPERASDAEAESIELPPRRRLGSLLRRAKTEPEPDVPVAAGAWPEAEFEASGQEPEVVPETESRGRFRSFLRRREPEIEPLPEPPPRHVKLLPRRSEPHPDSTEREVAELFDPGDDSVDAEETAG